MSQRPDWVTVDAFNNVTIDGITYSRQFFTALAENQIGSVGRITKRESGIVTFERVEMPHASDCATNNAPALPAGGCDCRS